MILALCACLVNTELYNERLADLADLDGDGVHAEDDCDDLDDTVFPGAPETCDGVDNDCDGGLDEGFASVPEACNGLDDDCNGSVDDEATDAPTWYADADGDGFGDGDRPELACDAPAAHVADATDCDDTNGDRYPGNTEVAYDGVDQDCDGDDLVDLDLDGYPATEAGGDDCDDADPETFPGADETWARGFTDSDCDGGLEEQLQEFGTDVFTGRNAGGEAGASMAALGDVDGTGAHLFAVAAYYDSQVDHYAGAVFLVRGVATGALADEEVIEADEPYTFLGTGIDGGRDIDGDGRPDLLLGATGHDSGRGATTLTLATALAGSGTHDYLDIATATVLGEEEANYLGARAQFLGDVDGDGLDDLATSAPYASHAGLPHAGRVYVTGARALAASSSVVTATDADTIWSGSEGEAAVGNNLHAIGDQDGDGRADVAISNGTTQLWVVRGGSPSGTVDALALTQVIDAVADTRMVGDLDADGRLDLLVLGDAAAVYTDLSASPTWVRDDAYTTLGSDGDAVTDAIDLGDRDADGRAESILFVESRTAVGSGWAGVLAGEDLGFGREVQLGDLRLQAVATRRGAAFGCRAVTAGDIGGDGGLWFAVGGRLDDEGGDDAGAVALLPVPE